MRLDSLLTILTEWVAQAFPTDTRDAHDASKLDFAWIDMVGAIHGVATEAGGNYLREMQRLRTTGRGGDPPIEAIVAALQPALEARLCESFVVKAVYDVVDGIVTSRFPTKADSWKAVSGYVLACDADVLAAIEPGTLDDSEHVELTRQAQGVVAAVGREAVRKDLSGPVWLIWAEVLLRRPSTVVSSIATALHIDPNDLIVRARTAVDDTGGDSSARLQTRIVFEPLRRAILGAKNAGTSVVTTGHLFAALLEMEPTMRLAALGETSDGNPDVWDDLRSVLENVDEE